MDTLERLLFNLQIIANIPKGKRINTSKEFIIIEDDSVFQPINRWRAGETRSKAVQVVCREIRTVIGMAKYILESKYLVKNEDNSSDYRSDEHHTDHQNIKSERIKELRLIRSGVIKASVGISNLCDTYCEDSNVLANLQPLANEISSCVDKITNLLVDIGELSFVGKRVN